MDLSTEGTEITAPVEILSSEKGKRAILAAHAEQARRKAAGLPIGRPKGVQNKLTATTRKALLAVFENLEGIEGMTKWARKHPGQFYSLLVKATPREREGNSLGTGIVINVGSAQDLQPVIEIVDGNQHPE